MTTASKITGAESAYPTNSHKHDETGLTKREYLAGLAMQSLMNDLHSNTSDRLMHLGGERPTPISRQQQIADRAVSYADALLEALEDD